MKVKKSSNTMSEKKRERKGHKYCYLKKFYALDLNSTMEFKERISKSSSLKD